MLDPALFRLDRLSSVPLHEQLRAQLAVAIRVGSVAPGGALPTIRTLAAQLDLAPGTVARSYAELERDGLVVGRRRAGTVVVDEPPESEAADERRQRAAEAAGRFCGQVRRLGMDLDGALDAVRDAWGGPDEAGTDLPG